MDRHSVTVCLDRRRVINLLNQVVAILTAQINKATEMNKHEFIIMINNYKSKLIKVLDTDFLKQNAESTGSTGSTASGRRLKKRSRRHNKKRGKRTRATRSKHY